MQLCLYSVVVLLGSSISGCGKGGGIAQAAAAESHHHEQQGSCFHHVFVVDFFFWFWFWFCFGGHLQRPAVLVRFHTTQKKKMLKPIGLNT